MKSFIEKYQKYNVLFIAELGSSHMGDIHKAYKLIDELQRAGVHIIKLQHIIANEILHPKTGGVSLFGKEIQLYQRFLDLQKSPDFFQKIKNYCEQRNILFLCSSFGLESSEDLLRMGVEAFKVASPESNYSDLLRFFHKTKKPVFLSTGVTQLKDIQHSMSILNPEKTAIFHCITEYPANEEEANLLLIPTLYSFFQTHIGLSDHSLDPFFIPEVAMALSQLQGEVFILEKHVTLDKTAEGLDDPIAITPLEVKELLQRLKSIYKSISPNPALFDHLSIHKKPHFNEIETISNILSLSLNKNLDRIRHALGDGVKKLAPSEEKNYPSTNRSFRATSHILKGDKISKSNISFLRSEKNLEVGMDYSHENQVLNSYAKNDIKDGEAITPNKLHL